MQRARPRLGLDFFPFSSHLSSGREEEDSGAIDPLMKRLVLHPFTAYTHAEVTLGQS
jgi:hypothetical protein